MLEDWKLPTRIQDLRRYKQIGITSLDLNAERDTQIQAILTLSKDLSEILETSDGQTSLRANWSPKQHTKGYNPESNDTERMRIGATSGSRMPPVDREVSGFEQETANVEEPTLCDTTLACTLRDGNTREKRETRKTKGPTETRTAPGPRSSDDSKTKSKGEEQPITGESLNMYGAASIDKEDDHNGETVTEQSQESTENPATSPTS
jgi:hypothetical protein